jgi:HAD superfamily hydrolase (TIGR01509 family)
LKIKHIIFDCDGVLIDSEEISMRVDQALLAENQVMISEADMHRRFVGTTFQAMVNEIEAEYAIELPADLEQRKDQVMIEAYRRELKAITGVSDALDVITLSKSIGTNGPRRRALLALDITQLAKHFGARLTTFEDVTHGKPAPDVYVLAAERAGFPPQHCLVVEDSLTGVTAAVAAGCPTVGFTGTHLHRDQHGQKLLELGAFRLLADMSDLPALVLELT